MNMTDYLKDALRDHVLGISAYTMPSGVYLAFFTDATDDAGGGTELTGGGYARQEVTWQALLDAGEAENDAAVTFSNLPADTVTHGAYFDSISSGNMLLHEALPTPITFTLGQNYTFSIGDLTAAFS